MTDMTRAEGSPSSDGATPATVRPARRRLSVAWRIAIVVSVVALVIVASFLWYLMSLPFGSPSPQPHATLDVTGTGMSRTFTVADLEGEAFWADVTILLLDPPNATSWFPNMTHMGTGSKMIQDLGEKTASGHVLWCNATDLNGNGMLNNGDGFSIHWTDDSISCSGWQITILWEPTAQRICESVTL